MPDCAIYCDLLEWVAMPSSRDLPHPGIELVFLMSPILAGRFFTTSATRKDVFNYGKFCNGVSNE